MVGDREGGLAVGGCGTQEIVDARRAVEHGVLGVSVEVDERAHGTTLPAPRGLACDGWPVS